MDEALVLDQTPDIVANSLDGIREAPEQLRERMVVAVLMRSASCVSVNRWRAHSVWCMTMISRVPSMLCESAMAFIASRGRRRCG